jgi:hypothetical protein
VRGFVQISLLVLLLTACGEVFAAPRGGLAQKDVFFGDGGAGPYPLAWTAVLPGTESVFVDGQRRVAGLDYALEPAAGVLRFSAPLERGQLIQVDYRVNRRQAKANRTALQAPFALTVLERGQSNLKMLGAMQQGPGGLTPGLLGISTESHFGVSTLSGIFLTHPVLPAGGPARAGDRHVAGPGWQETSGLRLGAEGKGRSLQYRAAFSQTGAQFTGAPQLQTPPGIRRVELAAAFQASKQLSVEAKSERTDALVDARRGEERSTEQLRLSYQPSGSTSLRLSQESTGKMNAAGQEEEIRQSRVQLDQKFGLRAQATALYERVAKSGTTSDDTRDRIALSVSSRPWQRLAITTRAEQTSSEREGEARVLGLGAEVQGPAGLSVGGGWTRTLSERTGARSDGQLRLALRGPLAAAWDVSRQESDRDGLTTASLWSIAAGAKGWLKLFASERDRMGSDGVEQSEERYRLEATPVAAIKVAAAIGEREVGDQPVTEEQEASLQLAPGKALSLGGSLRASTQGETSTTVTSVNGALDTALLDVGGQFRQREREGAADVTTRDLQLALTPADWLKLTGRYTENPEDKDGRVQDQVARSLGLQTRVGALTLGGSVTEVEARDRLYEKQQMELRLTLNVSSHSALYSTYQASDEWTGGSLQGRSYSFGFRHAVGSQFYLKLEGELTTYEQDGIALADREETRANLGLGLKF